MEKSVCIILFAKTPVPGRVKTRLAKSVGDAVACQVYTALAEHVFRQLPGLDATPLVFGAPAAALPVLKQWLGDKYIYFPQQGADLGERMHNAFTTAFAQGFEYALLVGTDLPELSADILRKGISLLKSHDAVLGPALDCGYYLIGFSRQSYQPGMFTDIPWSTGAVASATLERATSMGLSMPLLPQLPDLDTLTDARRHIQLSALDGKQSIFSPELEETLLNAQDEQQLNNNNQHTSASDKVSL